MLIAVVESMLMFIAAVEFMMCRCNVQMQCHVTFTDNMNSHVMFIANTNNVQHGMGTAYDSGAGAPLHGRRSIEVERYVYGALGGAFGT